MKSREIVAWVLLGIVGVLFAGRAVAQMNPASAVVFVAAKNEGTKPLSVVAVDVSRGHTEIAKLGAGESLKFGLMEGQSVGEVSSRAGTLVVLDEQGNVVASRSVNAEFLWKHEIGVSVESGEIRSVARTDPWKGPVRRMAR